MEREHLPVIVLQQQFNYEGWPAATNLTVFTYVKTSFNRFSQQIPPSVELAMLKPLCRLPSCAHARRITAHQRIACRVLNNECGVSYLVPSLRLTSV